MTTENHTTESESPKDHRLFHYTPEREYLEDMLTKGLWPRYCVEEFTWLLGSFVEPTYIAFPMVCFCDIPTNYSGDHREKYGHYAISINKSSTKELDVNPVWNLDATSTLSKQLMAFFDTKGIDALTALPTGQKAMLPYLKSSIGAQASRNEGYTIKGLTPTEIISFEEEFEWRHTPPALADTWLEDSDKNELQAVVNEMHTKSEKHRISLTAEMIDSIFVPSAEDHKVIITLLDKLYPSHNIQCHVWPDSQSHLLSAT